MSSKFQKKKFSQLKREEELILDRDLIDFQGTKTELFFIKLGRKISRNRLPVFGGMLFLFILFGSFLGYIEYAAYKEAKATEKLEILIESWQKDLFLSPEKKIQQLETFRESEAYGLVHIRLAKTLSDLYAQIGNYTKAAELLEESAQNIKDLKEARAFYYFLAGSYRELANEKEKSLKNYEISSSLLEDLRETALFRGWSLFHAGRLNMELGNSDLGSEYLRKVLALEPGEARSDLTEVRKLSAYLLLKVSKSE